MIPGQKVEPLHDGYECLVSPYERRAVTALDVVLACDTLANAGFTMEAIAILAHVLIGREEHIREVISEGKRRYG